MCLSGKFVLPSPLLFSLWHTYPKGSPEQSLRSRLNPLVQAVFLQTIWWGVYFPSSQPGYLHHCLSAMRGLLALLRVQKLLKFYFNIWPKAVRQITNTGSEPLNLVHALILLYWRAICCLRFFLSLRDILLCHPVNGPFFRTRCILLQGQHDWHFTFYWKYHLL